MGRWLRGIIREVQKGELMVDFVVREEMTNPVGMLHGGMIAAIMDEMIGATIFTLGRPTFYLSISLSIDFLASAKGGETVTARTRLIRQGQTVINAECELYNVREELLARGTSSLLRANFPPSPTPAP